MFENNSSFTDLEQRLIGCLLGDGWLERKSPKANVRFRYEQSKNNADRFYFLYQFFVFYCLSYSNLRVRFDKRTNNTYYSLHFSTRSLPIFNPFYILFTNKLMVKKLYLTI